MLVAASGCATKDWVRDLMGTKEAEINQRVDGLSGQVRETAETAKGARERADAAMNRVEDVNGRLTRLWQSRYNQKPADTVEIYFAFDRADLSDGAQTALAGVVKELAANPTLTVRLGGFTDGAGTRDYNYGLAQRRVEAVRRYLAERGVQLARVQAIGMGPLEERGMPDDRKRRVTVTLMTDSE